MPHQDFTNKGRNSPEQKRGRPGPAWCSSFWGLFTRSTGSSGSHGLVEMPVRSVRTSNYVASECRVSEADDETHVEGTDDAGFGVRPLGPRP